MLLNPTYLHWLILGCIFVGLEILAPGAFFLWLGIAALASAIVQFVFPSVSWEVQYVLFAAFCILSLVAWKRFGSPISATKTDKPKLNQRGQQYLGRALVLSEAIENGVGKVRVDDSQWKVRGSDAPEGSTVTVVKVDGSILHVE